MGENKQAKSKNIDSGWLEQNQHALVRLSIKGYSAATKVKL